jgi:hypothetical protein
MLVTVDADSMAVRHGGLLFALQPKHVHGEWCGPLVPAEEVKAAFIEGVIQTDMNFNAEACYEYSLARRVALGEET